MKYTKKTKNYIIVKDEHLLLNPLLRPKFKKPKKHKHYVTDKTKYLILNEMLPQRRAFGTNKAVKYPQTNYQLTKYLRKNYPIKKDMPFSFKAYLVDKDYRKRYKMCDTYVALDTNKTSQKIFKAAKSALHYTKITVACAAIVLGTYFATTYGPGIIEYARTTIEAKNRPQTQEVPDFNYGTEIPDDNNMNTDFDNVKDEDKSIIEIKLNEDSLTSYELLKESNLNLVMQMYFDDNRTVTPMFLYPEEREDGSKSLKLFCKLGETDTVSFEYDIYDEDTFDDLFNSESISPSDVINALSILASDENIADLPQISPIINVENTLSSFTTEVHEDTKTDIIDGEFVEEDIYSFKVYTLENNGTILERQVDISKEKAQNLEGFDENDLYSLARLYAQNPESFKNDTYQFEVGYNAPTIIIVNANRQSKETTKESNSITIDVNKQISEEQSF